MELCLFLQCETLHHHRGAFLEAAVLGKGAMSLGRNAAGAACSHVGLHSLLCFLVPASVCSHLVFCMPGMEEQRKEKIRAVQNS